MSRNLRDYIVVMAILLGIVACHSYAHGQQQPEPTWIVNVRDFGASPSADGATNARAFQAAHDSFAGMVKNDANGQCGVVKVPAGSYVIDRTIWSDLPNVEWRGDGNASLVRMDPRYRHNVLQFGVPRSGLADGHRVDATGKLDATAGKRWGLRTLGDSWVQFQAGPFDQGPTAAVGGYATDLWGEAPAFCLEVCCEPADGKPFPAWAPICGIKGSRQTAWDPRPFWLCAGDDGKSFLFCFRTADQDEYGLDVRSFRVPIGTATPPYRICVQVDFAAGVAAAWLNNVQVTPAQPQDLDGLKGLRFLPNNYLPFTIGASGPRGFGATNGSDLRVYGLKLSRAAKYTVGAPGSAQARADVRILTDTLRYFAYEADTVAYLPLKDDSSAGRVVACQAGGAGFGCASSGIFMSPIAGGTIGNAVRDMQVLAGNGYGQAISLGAVLDAEVEGVTAAYGCHGIGSWNVMANYTVKVSGCSLHGYGSPYYGFMQIAWARNVELQTNGRVGLRLVGCSSNWENVFVAFPAAVGECFARLHALDYGGLHAFRNVLVDFEGATYSRAGVVADAHPYTPATSLRMQDVSFGSVGKDKPLVELIDVGTLNVGLWNPAVFVADGLSAYPPHGDTVRLTGPLWRGEVRNTPGATVSSTGKWGPGTNVTVQGLVQGGQP